MKTIFSGEIDNILNTGIFLGDFGTNNWALTRSQVLDALEKLHAKQVPVLGGDVLEKKNGVFNYTYDNWHCEPEKGEKASDFTERSISKAKEYIKGYKIKNEENTFFTLVPESSLTSVSYAHEKFKPKKSMKPKWKKIIWISIAVLICLFILHSLHRIAYNLFEGKTGYSCSIAKARELGVFVKEYKMLDDSINLGYEAFIPGEIWLEKVWKRGDYDNPVIIRKENEYSSYWLYIEISENAKKTRYKISNEPYKDTALETVEGSTFWHRGCGEKEFFIASFIELPGKKTEVKVIKRQDTTNEALIPTRWPNPILVDTITLVENEVIGDE